MGAYVIEMRSQLFEKAILECKTVVHLGTFKIDKPYSQSDLNKIDCMQVKINNDLVSFLKLFGSLTTRNENLNSNSNNNNNNNDTNNTNNSSDVNTTGSEQDSDSQYDSSSDEEYEVSDTY